MLVIVIGKIAIAATIAMTAKAAMMIGSLELLISYPQFGQNLLWAVSCSLHFGQVLSVDFPQSVQNASFSLIYAPQFLQNFAIFIPMVIFNFGY